VRDMGSPATFADIAVALTLASSKLQLDLAQTRIIAGRIGLSQMGLALVVEGLERDAELVRQGIELFKKMSEVEPQVRAVIERKVRRRWPEFARAAVL
jgi:predicted ATP-dependent serine protease